MRDQFKKLILDVVVPGSLTQRTGGYVYDRRMVQGLRSRGWDVSVHELEGSFPGSDLVASNALAAVLESIGDGGRVLIDGLVMGGLPRLIESHSNRLRILSLVHHLLSDEFGLTRSCRESYRTLELEALRACVGVLTTSRFTASRLNSFGIPPHLVRWVVPGVEQVDLAKGRARVGPPQLLCVASVIPRKGHDVLVKALSNICDLPWKCIFVGSLKRAPRYVESVFTLVEELGMDNRVNFRGECDDLALSALYDESSIFVLASYFEGYGMVLAEALSRGLPVVSTKAGAIVDTVPVDVGILVEPGDEYSLAEALRGLLRNPSRRTRLSVAARKHAKQLSSWEEAVAEFSSAILELTPQLTRGDD